MTKGWTSAVMGDGGRKRETAPLCRFCFYCTRSLGNTVYPGFNGSVASLGAHQERWCMHDAQGERMQPGPSSRGRREGATSLPPGSSAGAHPRPQPWHGSGASGGCRAPAPYRRLEVSTRRGVIHARVSPRCLNEGRWVAASGSSCNLPPSSPGAETVFLLFFFFLCSRRCCLPPQPLPAAGRHPSAAACALRLGGMASTAARQPSKAAAHLQQQDG